MSALNLMALILRLLLRSTIMSHFKINKKALIGAALLATAPTVKADGTVRSSTEGSKSKRGINLT